MAQAPKLEIEAVEYVDRWGANPRGKTYLGAAVTLEKGGEPGQELAGRLMQGSTPIAYGSSGPGMSANVEVKPPGPLIGGPFSVEVQWCAEGEDPSALGWGGGNVARAPLVASGLNLSGGRVEVSGGKGTINLSWEGSDGAQPDYAFVQVVRLDQTGKEVELLPTKVFEGASGSIPFSPQSQSSYLVYVAPAALIGSIGGNPVRSIGPFSQPLQIPVEAPTVTGVAYDGSVLSATWQAPPAPAGPAVAALEHSLVVLAAGVAVANFPAAAGGGAASVDLPALEGEITVAGSVSFGSVSGPLGQTKAALAAAPRIAAVSMSPAKGKGETDVSVTLGVPASLPGAAAVRAQLLKDGVAVVTKSAAAAPAPVTVTLTAAIEPGHAYSVLAQAVVEDGKGKVVVSGPVSEGQPLPTGQPGTLSGSYDGERVELAWGAAAEPHLSGYEVALSGGLTGTYVTGPLPALSLPAPSLGVGSSLKATVTPLAGLATGLATELSYAVPEPLAPTISAIACEGEEVTLNWAPSAGPWLDGYLVTATATAAQGAATPPPVVVSTGLETSATLLLPAQESPGSWALTVAALARGTAGPKSAPASLFPAEGMVIAVTGDGATATVRWQLSPWSSAVQAALLGGAVSLQVQVLDGGNVVAARNVIPEASGSTAVPLPATPTGRLTAAVQLLAAGQVGPRSGRAPVLAAKPTILFGALVDGCLDLWWSATEEAGVVGYEVCCGTTCATATETHLTLPLAGAKPGDVSVQAVGPGAAGPSATAKLVAAYGIASGSYAGGKLTVSLTAAESAQTTDVWVDALVGGKVAARSIVPGDATSAELDVALPPGAAASVRATGVGAASLAPESASRAIPTSVPRHVRAVYDGQAVHAAWEPVADPGVTGYLVTLAGATPPVPPQYVAGAAISECSLAAAMPPPFPGTATVSVQAAVAFGSNRIDGPAGVAVPELAGAVRAVAASTQTAGLPPFLYRRGAYSSLATVQGGEISISLPDPFASATEKPSAQDSAGTFKLEPYADPLAGTLPYQLTIAASGWDFSADEGRAARSSLRAAYREFLRKVDANGPAPGGIALVRHAIATALPQTFAETLFYRYGLWLDAVEGKLRGVDLDAGLRLRISGAEYQAPPGITDKRTGFVTVGGDTYDLGQVFPAGSEQAGLGPALTVDAFLSRLFPGGQGGSAETAAAGPVDFFGAGGRQAYFRLFFPRHFLPSESPGSPAEPSITNIVVIGAPSWTALEQATTEYEAEPSLKNLPAGIFSAYFRGRVTLTPLAAVSVNGGVRWVPLGTTVRDLLAAEGAPALGAVVGSTPAGVSLTRVTADAYDSALGGAPLRRDRVDLTGADLASAVPPALWPLDLPVLGGDELSIRAWEPPLGPG